MVEVKHDKGKGGGDVITLVATSRNDDARWSKMHLTLENLRALGLTDPTETLFLEFTSGMIIKYKLNPDGGISSSTTFKRKK